MAVLRSDMPPTTPGFRPGADTLVGQVVRLTAPGQSYTEEVPAADAEEGEFRIRQGGRIRVNGWGIRAMMLQKA
jgi:hypothetical protein